MSIRNALAIATAFAILSSCEPPDNSDDQTDTHNGLIRAWLIVEATVTTSTGTSTNENPKPGIYIFTERHISNMLCPNTEGRSPFTDERTDDERVAPYDNFIAHSGSYEVTDLLLTTHNIIAKVPNAMNGDFPINTNFT